ncbi:MAG: vanadium-dependent haloperoxidase [Saprospiraceae bacterium]|nr:vanadium-dependent haloperoxidase [Saprospiraceae bacterium]HMW38398.1 vanadium-dependent haloperoxidase [Saprospiraceae bacterium]HMX87294.1 vanadium-dependent haloperoxidase [Saprospiraceae bacterium]HMZ39121.1 vanadium-dependent haloperoxidase [Saprospiraceae bacterium]HNA63294.1 vanadium-dependent haloperoxidase [Saprospiraceae bacterium]
MSRWYSYLLCLTFLTLGLHSCTNDDDKPVYSVKYYSGKVASDWFEMVRGLTKTTPGFSPPVASRAMGYCGIALYQSLVAGMPKNLSLEGQLPDLGFLKTRPDESLNYRWDIVANAALANMCRLLYPTATDSMKNLINKLESDNLNTFGKDVPKADIDKAIAYGTNVSSEIFEWSKTDGGHEGYSKNFPANYVVPQGPGLWVPTSAQKIPLQPYWGNNRTFVLGEAEAVTPPLDLSYSEDRQSAFYKQALEVYNTSENLTQEQEIIAKYWSDDAGLPGTPPGHSISVLNQIASRENLNLAACAETYAQVSMALSDAFVCCWRTKYIHNLLRPVTYINALIDPSWKTLLATPPFPEFTSGHSVQSGAFAAVMSARFGSNYSFTDHTHEARTDINGTARTFSSFKAMADEAAISRLYGGIHYREAIDDGVAQGGIVGNAILALHWKK